MADLTTREYRNSELEEVFSKPPLREVAFEIRFTPRLRVQAEIWRLQDQLVDVYPVVSTESAIQTNGAVIDISVFQDPVAARTLKVSSQNFVVAFSRYLCFEDFKEEITARVRQFCSTFGVDSFTRVGLRYVNEISMPELSVDSLLEYVRPMVDFDRFPLRDIDQFATEVRAQYRSHMVTVRGVLLPGLLRTYVLDIDCHTESPKSSVSYPELLELFHDSAQRIFLDHITDRFKEVMRGKP